MRHRDAAAQHGGGGVVVYFSMTPWRLMLNLSLCLCTDPELLVFVERGPNGHKGALVYSQSPTPPQKKTFLRGLPAGCEGMLQPSHVATTGHA